MKYFLKCLRCLKGHYQKKKYLFLFLKKKLHQLKVHELLDKFENIAWVSESPNPVIYLFWFDC